MNLPLKDRVAIVTGGGTGMGRAIAERFAREGARVVVNYCHSRQESEEVAAGIQSRGSEAAAIQADVSREPEVKAMMRQVEDRWGRLDILVNNAGWSTIVPHKNLEDLTDEIWDRTLNTNLRGAFYCVRAAVPLLRKQPGSSIINIASVAGLLGVGSSMVYAASKAGLLTMTKSLARALAPEIRVNAIAPGLVHTRFAGWPPETFEEGAKVTPLQRIATVDEIANAAYFFAAEATAITGETIVVDGGLMQLRR